MTDSTSLMRPTDPFIELFKIFQLEKLTLHEEKLPISPETLAYMNSIMRPDNGRLWSESSWDDFGESASLTLATLGAS